MVMQGQERLLYGWDATTSEWIKLQVDASGFVKVDLSAVDLGDLGDVNLAGIAANDIIYWNTVAGEWQPIAMWVAAHAASHELGGADEIDVGGLSGQLADDQHVKDAEVLAVAAALVHAARHELGGADEIDVGGLSGQLADDQHVKDAEVDARVNIHALLTTGIHGVGAGAIVGTTLAQVLTNKTLTAPIINGVVTTTGLTLPAFTLGGKVTLNGQVFDAGAGECTISTTGLWGGFALEGMWNGAEAVRFVGRVISTTPLSSDYLVAYAGYGKDLGGADSFYGQMIIQIEAPVDGAPNGKILWQTGLAGGANDAMKLSSLGVLDVDASSGLGAATVGEFDELDDAIILRQGISERQLEVLESIGVMSRKDTGSGWMLNLQAMCYLLAGGIYQNRAKIDRLEALLNGY